MQLDWSGEATVLFTCTLPLTMVAEKPCGTAVGEETTVCAAEAKPVGIPVVEGIAAAVLICTISWDVTADKPADRPVSIVS